MVEVSSSNLRTVLRDQFGHAEFRAGQEQIITSLLNGQDVLAILPTGGGKSLVYQLAAQLLPGITLVVSPLLALMKDQVEALEERGLRVGLVNSVQSASESARAVADAIAGRTKLLYVTPERFDDPDFMADARKMSVSLFVVDEAHSISEWGHSFRPAYLALPTAITQLKRPTLLALTATATPWVRRDIAEQLGLRNPVILVRGTDRPNLFFEVTRIETDSEDRRVLRDLLTSDDPVLHGSGIIYTATRRGAQETAAWLEEWGVASDYYHGQRNKLDRERVQDAFMAGDIRVIAATNAFGMGIDKPDVRFVLHRDIPASLESYYQEAGRAGRDGEPARCTLIYRPADLGRAAFLAGGGELTREDVIAARAGLVALGRESVTLKELQTASGVGRADLMRLVNILKEERLAEFRRGRVRLKVADFDPQAVPLEREAHRRAYERSRLEMMRAYAELRECRRRYILNYFGEEPDWRSCDRCDVDLDRPSATDHPDVTSGSFRIDDRVEHPSFGQGVVLRIASDVVTVLFDEAGYRTLDAALVQEQDLLTRL